MVQEHESQPELEAVLITSLNLPITHWSLSKPKA